MIDGIGTVYIDWRDFAQFIIKQADLKEDTKIEIGRPRCENCNDFIEVDVVFSDNGGEPCDCYGEKVVEINKSWEEK